MSLAQGLQIAQNRRALRHEKQVRDQELQRMGYSFDEDGQMQVRQDSAAEAEQLAGKEAAQLARALQGKLAAQETDKAFEDFAFTGDASYLQKALKSDPALEKAWGERGIQMVSNIDFENDEQMLKSAGIQPTFYDTEEKREVLKKNMYKVYNGKDWQIGLANKAVAETGAIRRMGKRRAAPLVENYKAFMDMLSGPKVSPNTAEGHKYEPLIMASAEKYNLPPNLIAAQMHAESAGNSKAVSPKGAQGLMQLMPGTAQELGVTNPMDPAQNIDAGAKYLRQMLDKYDGNMELALAAYNAGPGNVDKYGGVPPFSETQNYVSKILGNLDEAESYRGGTHQDVVNTILEHRRAIANAEKGTTNANVDNEVKQSQQALDLKSDELQLKNKELFVKMATDGVTSTQKDLTAADNYASDMFEQFGGEDQFYQTDFTDDKNYKEAMKSIIKIERLTGTEPSEADKKSIADIRQLITLADPAKDLSAGQTGILDSTIKGIEKYINDNVDGVEAKAAYSAFRNSVRNALFGSALTEGEIKAFNEAYGTIGNKLGPVLSMFQTSLSQVQAKLDSSASMMNPASAKVRLGADQETLANIRDALQARIDYISGIQNPDAKPKGNRKPLDQIFGG